MTPTPSQPNERFEDVFQDEILRLIPQDEFKEFARSSSGLCLSALEVDEVVNDYQKAREQKIQLLFKWLSKNPDATPDTIRTITRNFLWPDLDEEFCDEESKPLTETVRIYPNKMIGARDWILEGKQKMHRGARKLAIKLLRWDEETQQEADILLDLRNHQNIVMFVASGCTQQGFFKYLYIAMELCHVDNLCEHIEKGGEPFNAITAYSRAWQLTCGLHYMHSQNIRHRDLKPHNVLLSLDLKQVKIADFGLSKTVPNERSCTATNSRSLMGTNGYRAPEAYNHSKYTKKGDIFSLGLVVYFIWSDGGHPFGLDHDEWNRNIKHHVGPDFTQLRLPQQDHIKAQLFLNQLLSFEEDKRPNTQTLHEWITEKGLAQKFDEDIPSMPTLALRAKKEPRPQILIFSTTSKKFSLSLCSLDPADQPEPYDEVKMEKIMDTDMFTKNSFSAVSIGGHIYLLTWIGYIYIALNLDTDPSWKKFDDETLFLHGKWPACVVIKDKIYVCGGGWEEDKGICVKRDLPYLPGSATCDVFDTAEEKWSAITEMHQARRHHALAADGDHMYAVGGQEKDGQVLKSAEKYDCVTGEWSMIAPLNTERFRAAAVGYRGKIYVHGGKDFAHTTLGDVECYDPRTGAWTVINEMTIPRSLFRVCVCDDKLYAIAGDASGLEEFPVRMSIEMWDPETDEGWKKFKPLEMDLERSASIVFTI